jgi:predicted nucleotidyltransferase
MPSGIPLEDCLWPDVPEPFLSAFKEAVRFVFENYDGVVGVFACGSVARGAPDASSDIDLFVVRHSDLRQRVQKFFNGVPAEIFINPPRRIRRSFEDEWRSRRLIVAHLVGTGVLVWHSEPVVLELQCEARALLERSPEIPSDLTYARYRLTTGFEDAVDKLEKDPATARLILFAVLEGLIDFAFLKSGQRVPRMKDWLLEFRRVYPELIDGLERCYRSDSIKEQFDLAEQLMNSLVGARGFFEWSSEPEVVPA